MGGRTRGGKAKTGETGGGWAGGKKLQWGDSCVGKSGVTEILEGSRRGYKITTFRMMK